MRDEPLVLFDVDNTLFDNDGMTRALDEWLRHLLGDAAATRYRQVYEQRRDEFGYADYLGSLQVLREPGVNDAELVQASTFLLEYPFARGVFPGAMDALASAGDPFILSDGDVVFQPHKVRRAGLWDAVQGRVLIHVHKEKVLARIAADHPAPHYIVLDDKLRLLAAIKQAWGDKVTTVFVRQGHYALDAKANADYPPADVTLDHIGQFADADIPARSRPPRARGV